MSKTIHIIYIAILSLVVTTITVLLIYDGKSYYQTSFEERFYHEDHKQLKPSGIIGHGLGIAGSFLMLIGVSSYMIRKRMKRLSRLGLLKHWLEFHIFLCTLGPIMVLFHTSFKFGGLVAISFWSMVAVFLSGVIGRFIYIQIPRTIEGRELSLQEVQGLKTDTKQVKFKDEVLETEVENLLKGSEGKSNTSLWEKLVSSYFLDNSKIKELNKKLKEAEIERKERISIIKLVKNELSLNRRIGRLQLMQDLFKYWHVAHLPFAIVMLVIMIIHVVVTIIFGYRWIW